MTTRTSLWEITSSVALIGMGAAGIMSPKGLQSSTFFPVLRDSAAPILVASAVFFVGWARLIVLIAFCRSKRARYVLAILSLLIWGQWAAGFAQVIPEQGVRPGMMQMLAMAFGELAFMYFLMKGRWSNGSSWQALQK